MESLVLPFFTTEVERAWTDWLHREYDQINEYYRLELSPPTIRIDNSKTRLGAWDPITREIRIHAEAIRKYPWNEVVDILKHEMAHQFICDRKYASERPHGERFREICRRMGLPDWAARATGDLPDAIPDWRQSTLTAEEQRLITKAQKLLALANSDNEHEASLAMQRVRELYAKYNLDQVREQKEAGIVSWIVRFRKRRTDAWESVILSILRNHFFVRVIHIKQFDAQELVEYPAAEVMGKKENVLMAEYVYHFLSNTLDSLWKKHQRLFEKRNEIGPDLRRHKRSYFLGVLNGFNRQLTSTREACFRSPDVSASETNALILAIDRELEAHFNIKYPRTNRRASARVNVNGAAFQQGRSDGAEIRLNRPLSQKPENLGLLLNGSRDFPKPLN